MAKGEREVYRVFFRSSGDLIATGTASQCAKATGLKPRTIQAYAADPRRVSKWHVEHVTKFRSNDEVAPKESSVFAEIENPTPYKGQTDGWGLHIQCRPSEGPGFFRRYSITEILAAMLYAK